MDENKVFIVGNLVRDPKLYDKCASFSVACTETWVKDGREGKRTDYPPCKTFNQKDINTLANLVKGDRVAVVGKVVTGSYEKNGQKVYSVEVQCYKVMHMGFSKGISSAEEDMPQNEGAEVNIPF